MQLLPGLIGTHETQPKLLTSYTASPLHARTHAGAQNAVFHAAKAGRQLLLRLQLLAPGSHPASASAACTLAKLQKAGHLGKPLCAMALRWEVTHRGKTPQGQKQ